jgi:5-methylcytosine-specific restriction endonuclease McrA
VTKRCTKCGETRVLAEFPLDKRCPGGRSARCKPCVNTDARERHARRMEDPAARRARADQARAWAASNPDKCRASAKRYVDAHPEELAARRAEWMAANPDYYREWYAKNADKRRAEAREQMRRSRAENPEAERNRKRRYRERHPERVAEAEREKTYARRAKMPFSPELAALMAELVTQPCSYCGATEQITIDHIEPLSRGGKHTRTNLASACRSCNSSKGAKTLDEWAGPPWAEAA